MIFFMYLASFLFLGCQQQLEALNEVSYEKTAPNVVISRSVFDYPENFRELYLREDYKKLPELKESHQND